jgi:hypothetical protein
VTADTRVAQLRYYATFWPLKGGEMVANTPFQINTFVDCLAFFGGSATLRQRMLQTSFARTAGRAG